MELSIIIVNYNQSSLLRACLVSIEENVRGLDFETLVVDNGSKDASVEMLKRDFPSVKVIGNQDNLGFSRANNQGIERSCGRYIVLLNNDTEVKPGAFEYMHDFMEREPHAGITGCRMRFSDGRAYRSFFKFPNILNEYLSRPFIKKSLDRSNFSLAYPDWRSEESRKVDWVSGACLMLRRSLFEKIGGLDEGFFMYYEDADYCLRAKRSGFEVYYLPQAQIVHHSAASYGPDSLKLELEWHKSRIRYYSKNSSFIAYLFLAMLEFYGSMFRMFKLVLWSILKMSSGSLRQRIAVNLSIMMAVFRGRAA